MSDNNSCVMVIFGGTGDLTRRKLIPALYQLYLQQKLPEHFAVASIGRKSFSTDAYCEELAHSMTNTLGLELKPGIWKTFTRHIRYIAMDYQDDAAYSPLKESLKDLADKNSIGDSRLFYLAVSPENFSVIVAHLSSASMTSSSHGWQRLVIEKPFGRNLWEAKRLNQSICEVFPEERIYRIDHYLGKEMIQNITMLRFHNAIFEPLWNHHYIDHVQIAAVEEDGVGLRGDYYDRHGALRDMIQSHLLQLLAIAAMDPPGDTSSKSLRDEKVRILSSIRPFSDSSQLENLVLGQYHGYRQEEKVAPDSSTETFVALKLSLDHPRWKQVPFYLITGKKLVQKKASLTVQFRHSRQFDWSQAVTREEQPSPNVLQIRIQPQEGVVMQMNVKRPGVNNQLDQAEMEYCQSCRMDYNSPEAYEKLLLDVMHGDATRFTRWDELAASWRLVDSIEAMIQENRRHQLCPYTPGLSGPAAAARLIQRDDRNWQY